MKTHKNEIYHKKMKKIDRNFEVLGLKRPQDEFKDLMLRARQLNFGLIKYTENPNTQKINHWIPTNSMFCSVSDLECYPTNKEGYPKANWICDKKSFDVFFTLLKKCSEFSIDIECHNYRSRSEGKF